MMSAAAEKLASVKKADRRVGREIAQEPTREIMAQ